MRPFELPEAVRKRLRANGSEAWAESLPLLIESLEREWRIAVQGSALSGGSEAFVALATMPDGTDAILKVLIPREDGIPGHEITALRLAGGEGCALVYRADPLRGAMLLERLGPPLGESSLPEPEKLRLLCDAARRMWRPAAASGLPTGAEKGRWLISYISRQWEALGRPCSERAVACAMDCLEHRIAAHDDGRSVLVHGDIHEWNALQAGTGYKLIDPDGLLAEREYDLGVIARQEPAQSITADPRALPLRLAALTGGDPVAIREWATAERLSTAFVCTAMDYQPMGRDFLAAAEAAAAAVA
jgi:streptomycin 6-kinase